MKKPILTILLLSCSLGVYAQQGGFEAGKNPPPQRKQDAGYKGSEDTRQTHIAQIRDFRQGGYVTLEGYIVKKLQGDTYQFRDDTGSITLQAPTETFKGETFTADDLVRISGKVYGEGDNTHLQATQIKEP